jgi:hypothetical protein
VRSQDSVSYYWKGDPDATTAGDAGFFEYRVGGSCNSGGGWVTVNTHQLDAGNNNIDEGWSGLTSGAIPDTATLVRFRNGSNAVGEDFRIDGITLAGLPD